MKPFSKALLVGLIGLPLAFAMGCGGDTETIETPEGTVQIDKDQNKIVIRDESGKNAMQAEMGENVSLPEDFPKDIPLYPKAKLRSSIAMAEGTMLMLESSASPEEILNFYKQALENQGWKMEGEMNMGGQRMSTYGKGGRGLTLTARTGESGTQFSLTLGQPTG